jgi:hypothetical protein
LASTAKVLIQVLVCQHLDDDVGAAAGQARQALEVATLAVIENMVRTLGADQSGAFVSAGSADHPQPGSVGHLRRGQADAAAGPVHQDPFTTPGLGSLEHRSPRCGVRHVDGRPLREGQPFGQGVQLVWLTEHDRGIRAVGTVDGGAADVHPVAGLDAGHPSAERLHHTGGIGAWSVGQLG